MRQNSNEHTQKGKLFICKYEEETKCNHKLGMKPVKNTRKDSSASQSVPKFFCDFVPWFVVTRPCISYFGDIKYKLPWRIALASSVIIVESNVRCHLRLLFNLMCAAVLLSTFYSRILQYSNNNIKHSFGFTHQTYILCYIFSSVIITLVASYWVLRFILLPSMLPMISLIRSIALLFLFCLFCLLR